MHLIDYHILRQEIRKMDYQSSLYKLLKEELSKRGNWKNRPRGVPGFKEKTNTEDRQAAR
jgi:hypothetical protein